MPLQAEINKEQEKCEKENPAWLNLEHWFLLDVVWERYTYLDYCDLWYRGGLGDITKTLVLSSILLIKLKKLSIAL